MIPKSTVLSVAVLGTITGTLLLAGCGVVPPRTQYSKVDLSTPTKAGAQDGYAFRHRRSILKVSYDASSKGYKVEPLPSELTTDGAYTPLYQVKGADDYRSTTQLKPTYADNTKFIDQIQVTTKDNIADTIQKVGEVVKAAIPLLATAVSASAAPPEVTFTPTVIDPAEKTATQWTLDPLNPNYCLRLSDAVSESQVTVDAFVASVQDTWTNMFPVPACSTGIVEIATLCSTQLQGGNPKIVSSIRVTFADAATVVPTRLPSTGSLKMNSICGASITEADKQDRSDILTYLTTGAKTAQDILSAWKDAKKKKQ